MVSGKDIIVYTGIFDDYDVLTEPKNQSSDITFVCFTDNENISSPKWDIINYKPYQSPNLNNRRIKILPHEYFQEYKYSVYIDGNIQPIKDLKSLVEKYLLEYNMAVPNHPVRSCVYDEAETCMDRGIGGEKIREQIESYRKSGFPEKYGLSQNNVILRVHNREKVKDAMESWWQEFNRYPTRDQLSLPYISWRENFNYKLIDVVPKKDWLGSDPNGYECEYFRPHPHVPKSVPRSVWEPIIYARSKLGYGRTSRYLTNSSLIIFFLCQKISDVIGGR